MGNGFSGQRFDQPDHIPVGRVKEGKGATGSSGTTGPTDPVHVVFRRLWKVVVDDVCDAIDVESSCGHIRCDENFQVAFSETAQNAVPDWLGLVPVQRVGRESGFVEGDGKVFRASFGPRKDDDLARFVFTGIQHFFQKPQFLGSMGYRDPFLMNLIR